MKTFVPISYYCLHPINLIFPVIYIMTIQLNCTRMSFFFLKLDDRTKKDILFTNNSGLPSYKKADTLKSVRQKYTQLLSPSPK